MASFDIKISPLIKNEKRTSQAIDVTIKKVALILFKSSSQEFKDQRNNQN